jgi:hypothetical protein
MMKMFVKSTKALALVCASAWSVSAGHAAVTTSYTIADGGSEPFKMTWDTHTGVAFAGALSFTKVSGIGPSGFLTVCTDIGAVLSPGFPYLYDSNPAIFNGHDGIRPTWGAGNQNSPPNPVNQANAAAGIQAAADIYYNHYQYAFSHSASDKAALQLAVWEALYDTTAGGSPSLSLASGRFKVILGDTAAINEASLWLSQVNYSARYAGSLMEPDPQMQNGFLAQEVFFGVTPVPEPTTMIAGALLLLPFGASTLRFVRKKRAA